MFMCQCLMVSSVSRWMTLLCQWIVVVICPLALLVLCSILPFMSFYGWCECLISLTSSFQVYWINNISQTWMKCVCLWIQSLCAMSSITGVQISIFLLISSMLVYSARLESGVISKARNQSRDVKDCEELTCFSTFCFYFLFPF